MMTKEERLAAMDWEHPDWEFLYHHLLYEVEPHNFVDKRTHRQAHEETIREAKFLRKALDELFARVGEVADKHTAFELIKTLRKYTPEA